MLKKFVRIFAVMIFLFSFAHNGLAEQNQETDPQNASPEAAKSPSREDNFEIVIHDNAAQEITNWTGQIFNIKDGKIAGDVSNAHRHAQFPVGNYVLMLHFPEEITELKGHRPFTFTITEAQKTTFTLIIGTSQTPDMEKGILRTVKGEDYLNFPLPNADPRLCKTKCEKDRNCGAYTYSYNLKLRKARCYLIRGPGTPGPGHPGAEYFSGVIQKNSSPYQVQITTEKREQEK